MSVLALAKLASAGTRSFNQRAGVGEPSTVSQAEMTMPSLIGQRLRWAVRMFSRTSRYFATVHADLG